MINNNLFIAYQPWQDMWGKINMVPHAEPKFFYPISPPGKNLQWRRFGYSF